MMSAVACGSMVIVMRMQIDLWFADVSDEDAD